MLKNTKLTFLTVFLSLFVLLQIAISTHNIEHSFEHSQHSSEAECQILAFSKSFGKTSEYTVSLKKNNFFGETRSYKDLFLATKIFRDNSPRSPPYFII